MLHTLTSNACVVQCALMFTLLLITGIVKRKIYMDTFNVFNQKRLRSLTISFLIQNVLNYKYTRNVEL